MYAPKAIAVLSLLVGLCGGCGEAKKTDTPPPLGSTKSSTTLGSKPAPVATTSENKTAYSLTAEEMAKECLTDFKAAEAKYKDKTVELSGTLRLAHPIAGFWVDGTPLKASDSLDFECIPPGSQEERLLWLTKGQKVKVKGRVGFVGPVKISLLDCQFTELEPAAKVTAAQLTEEFTKDKAAAEKKYDFKKEIVVEGTVSDLVKVKDAFEVRMAGAKPDVRLIFHVKEADWNQLKKGQHVAVKGTCSIFTEADGVKELSFGGYLLKGK